MTIEPNIVKTAIDLAGGAADVAKHFKISPVSVYEWINKGRVPSDRAPTIERLCKSAVKCEEICPGVDWAYLRDVSAPEPEQVPT